jgi:hypothetical protein
MVKEFLEYLQRERATVAAAPLTFLIAAVLVGGLAYAASRWKHSAIIELLRERLAAKDQQLDEYRERLHLVPAHGSEFSKQSHAELKAAALKLAANMREWLDTRNEQDSQRQYQQWTAMCRATDEVQRKMLWDAHTNDLIRSSTAMNAEYDSKFKIRAIILRDELLTRVQRPDQKSHAHNMYEHPTNPIGMRMVADDLELLARLLC